MEENLQNPPDRRVELATDRTDMANFRTQLALDRTTLAWIRTSLTLATFGFGMVGFFRSLEDASPGEKSHRLHENAIDFGVALIALGILAITVSGLSHWRMLRMLRQGKPPALTQWPLSIMVAVLVAILGMLGLWGVLAD